MKALIIGMLLMKKIRLKPNLMANLNNIPTRKVGPTVITATLEHIEKMKNFRALLFKNIKLKKF